MGFLFANCLVFGVSCLLPLSLQHVRPVTGKVYRDPLDALPRKGSKYWWRTVEADFKNERRFCGSDCLRYELNATSILRLRHTSSYLCELCWSWLIVTRNLTLCDRDGFFWMCGQHGQLLMTKESAKGLNKRRRLMQGFFVSSRSIQLKRNLTERLTGIPRQSDQERILYPFYLNATRCTIIRTFQSRTRCQNNTRLYEVSVFTCAGNFQCHRVTRIHTASRKKSGLSVNSPFGGRTLKVVPTFPVYGHFKFHTRGPFRHKSKLPRSARHGYDTFSANSADYNRNLINNLSVNHQCPLGFFGLECRSKCHCSFNRPCHPQNGVCENVGCSLGWNGSSCQQRACAEGSYGIRAIDESYCQWKCLCDNKNACHVLSGECSTGACEKENAKMECTPQLCTRGLFSAPHCINRCFCHGSLICHPLSGECPGHRCERSYKPPTCEHKLPDRFGLGTYITFFTFNCWLLIKLGMLTEFR